MSDVLSLVKELGETYDISSNEMAFCSINTIKNLALNADNIKETLFREIEKGKINMC